MFTRCFAEASRPGNLARWLLMLSLAAAAAPAAGQWPQWGGPNRDFSCEATGLADRWPEDGPRELWSREIGSGHSSMAVEGDRLYTMCRRDEQDAVLAIDIATGETVWETRYDAPAKPDMQLDFGAGPHATPLIVGDRVFTVGGMVHFNCLDKNTGKILWSHNLMDEMNSSHCGRGYGASPIAYRDLVILNVGPGRGQDGAGLAAFKQDTGEVAWKSEKFSGGYSSPILVRFNDEDHVIVALGADRLGLDPATGEVRWRTTVDFQSYGIMATPLWIPPDKVFCSAGYGGGTRLFQLSFADGKYDIKELWYYRKMQVVHGTMVHIGNLVYGSTHGSFGPAFLMAIDLETGKPAFRQRGVAKANVLYADGKFIILDETGKLFLGKPAAKGIELVSEAQELQDKAWTSPILVGTTLYLRDHHTIKALDLSAAASGS